MSHTAAVEGATELERLVHRSRLLGADPMLVVYGGGNTSTKLLELDHLGRERRVLRIKASGSDLASAQAADFPGLYLDDLLTLRDRAEMSDEELVAFVDRCSAEPSGRRPSIETLLHAFLPAAHVDHVHSDAICALTNTPRCEEIVAEALGADVAIVPYIRPGFALAKLVDELEPGHTAIVLKHHGLVTYGETHEESLARTFELEARARDYLATHGARLDARDEERSSEDACVELLPHLRGALSHEGRKILYADDAQLAIANRPDVDVVATVARSTPDHMLRIGRESAVIHAETWSDDLARFEERGAAPRVLLVPGLCCVGVGSSARDARMRAEIASHSHGSVAATLDAFGEVAWLDEREASEFLYWPLELYKLSLAPPPPELEGQIVLVTGASSGIGREAASALAARGAQVVLADLDGDGLDETAELIGADALAVAGDLSIESDVDRIVREAVKTFGGIDGVVSNAGVAVTGRLADLRTEDWEKSMAVNATSHFLVTRHVWPVLEAQGLGGSLVYVASKNAFSPGAGFGAYSAAKAAEVQIARIAALEGGALRIRANVVNPDAIFTGSRLWSDEMRSERAAEHGVAVDELESFYAARNLLGTQVGVADVAEAISFLISPRSAATTGCVLTVDGGVPGAFPR